MHKLLSIAAALMIGLGTSGCTIAHAHPTHHPAAKPAVHVVVHHAPPPRAQRHHAHQRPHNAHYVWIPGHWVGHGHQRHHVPGHWAVRPARPPRR